MLWEGNDSPLQYSCLENPMDGGACWAAVHEVARSQTWLSDFPFTFHFHALEKEMAAHSSVLAWRIPGTGEPDGLPSVGSHRVGHDWRDLAAAADPMLVWAYTIINYFSWKFQLFCHLFIWSYYLDNVEDEVMMKVFFSLAIILWFACTCIFCTIFNPISGAEIVFLCVL